MEGLLKPFRKKSILPFRALVFCRKLERKNAMKRGVLMNYTIYFTWDEEANVWIATSPNITGLVLESESLDKLIQKAKDAAPELVELNGQTPAKTISYVCNFTQQIASA